MGAVVAAGMIIGRFRRLPSVPFFSFPFSLFPLFEVRIGELNGIFAFSRLFFFFLLWIDVSVVNLPLQCFVFLSSPSSFTSPFALVPKNF